MSNSFSDSFTNPFEDPSVQNFTPRVEPSDVTLQGYNPFDKSQSPTKPEQAVKTPVGHKAVLPDVTAQAMQHPSGDPPPPPYTTSAAQSAALDLQRRQEELEKKAQELQAREENLANTVVGNARLKNWPPLPKKCCVGPCFYQDISVEIPDSFQKTVRTMYYMWLFYTFLLFLNMLGALALFIANKDGTTFGVSLLVSFLFTPLSFVCWFRPLYKAFRTDSSFNFMVFFVVFFFQFLVSVLYAVGIPHMGSCGLLNGITTLSTNDGNQTVSTYTVGIIAIFIGFLWAIDALASFFMLVKIHRMYRSTGASMAKAQEEFATGVMRNQHVQHAAASVVTTAAQEAVNRSASGVRY